MVRNICAQCGAHTTGMYMTDWDDEFFCWDCIEAAEDRDDEGPEDRFPFFDNDLGLD